MFKDGVNTDTLGQAIELTKADLASLCVRNPSACEAAQSGLSCESKSGHNFVVDSVYAELRRLLLVADAANKIK